MSYLVHVSSFYLYINLQRAAYIKKSSASKNRAQSILFLLYVISRVQ